MDTMSRRMEKCKANDKNEERREQTAKNPQIQPLTLIPKKYIKPMAHKELWEKFSKKAWISTKT